MNLSKIISYILIAIGGVVAVYAQAQEDQNQMILIGGIVVLMIGVYSVSRGIPGKSNEEDTKDDNQ
ncbi:hypothetical protein OE09_1389 [Flavobacteriaceae bacterium MAR_2010_72]|nr:hypothetical protein OE09_1389 [Flavobacteriaceae bacterium MAR_2010_72]TVZ59882.1 hypothetical protein NA63_2424 [Flavobacteriaceae bacterium MAR_2010_105]